MSTTNTTTHFHPMMSVVVNKEKIRSDAVKKIRPPIENVFGYRQSERGVLYNGCVCMWRVGKIRHAD